VLDRLTPHEGPPPEPNAATHPKQHAKWQRETAHPLRPITPEFEPLTQRTHVPQHVTNNATTSTWSGAVVTEPPRGQRFTTISAVWIVPNVYPPTSAWDGDDFKDGTYHCSSWVGIDGWAVDELLQAGTAQECIVKDGRIQKQHAYAWFEWWPGYEIAFSNFPVKPGDLISGTVTAKADNNAFVTMSNLASGTTTSTGISAPPGKRLYGQTAEWIVEDPCFCDDKGSHPYLMPDFGATLFYDAVAGTEKTERDVGDATLVNMAAGSIRLSTAVREGDQVLFVYADTHGP
jgi:hypothetical protein